MKIKAVVFDAFGTLVQIKNKRHRPIGQLMSHLRNQGRIPLKTDAETIMSCNAGLVGICERLGYALPHEVLAELELTLYEELGSIRLYPEVVSTLWQLHNSGYKIGICSNLVAPYAVPVKCLLPFELDSYAWSFEVGCCKPDPSMYEFVCNDLKLQPAEIMFVGDTLIADVEGPTEFGMKSCLVNHQAPDTAGFEKGILKALDFFNSDD